MDKEEVGVEEEGIEEEAGHETDTDDKGGTTGEDTDIFGPGLYIERE